MRQNNRRTLNKASFYLVLLVGIGLSFATFIFTKSAIGKVSISVPILAPITVTKATPTLATDVNGNAVVNAGDTLSYSITVANGATDATGVIFTDVLNSNLTLVPGSVNSSPIARNDSFNALGNVKIDVPVANGVKTNDSDPDGTTPTITGFGNSLANANATAAAGAGTSAQGGNVTLNADGSFTYNPAPGFEGTDSFFYTLRDAGADGIANNSDDATDTAQVTLNVSGMIWFVNSALATNGDGRLSSPYNCLAGAGCYSASVNDPNDNIFLYTGTYTGGITLKSGQKLIGAGATASLSTIAGVTSPTHSLALPATNGTRPTVTNTAGVGILLNSGNLIRGLNASGSTFAIDDNGASIGNLTVSEMLINSTGGGFRADNGGGTISVTLDSLSAGGANGINLANITGGAFSVTGAVTVTNNTADSISLNTNTATFSVGGLTQINGTADTFSSIYRQGGTGAVTFANIEINGRRDRGIRIAGGSGNFTTGSVDIDNTNTDATTALEINALTGGTYSFGDTDINNNAANSSAIQVVNNCAACAVSFASGSTITGASGTDFDVNQGGGNITYNGTITNTAGGMISVTNRTGGTIDFTGNLSHAAASTAISLSGNAGGTIQFTGATKALNSSTATAVNSTGTGATINFVGGLDIDTTSGGGISATGGGTINVTTGANPNTIDTTTGTALNVLSTNIGASGLAFKSISANGAASGIILNNTGASGSLSVTGDTALAINSTGGTIQNTTGRGISLTNTLNPSFAHLSIQNTALSGIRGTLVNGFNLQYSTINNVNTSHTADDSNVALNSTVTGTDKNVTGAVTITNNVLNNSYQHGVDISQYDGTITNLNISSNSFTSSSTAGNSFGSAVRLQILGSATTAANLIKASINSNTVRNFPAGDGVIINAGNSVGALSASAGTVGSVADVIDIKNNDIQGFSSTTYLLNAIAVAVNKKGQGNFNIDSNGTAAVPMKFLGGNGVSCAAFGSVSVSCTINNNFMDLFNIASSAAINIGADSATASVFNETPNLTAIVTNNRVMHVDGNGIIATVKNTNGTGNFKIQNNNIDTPIDAPSPPYNPGFTHGIRVDSGVNTGGNANVCLNISGNTTSGGTTAGGSKAAGIGLRQEHSAGTNVFNIYGLSPNPSNDAQMTAYVAANNPNSATGTAGTKVNSISSGATFGACSLAIVAAADKELINTNDNVITAFNILNFSNESSKFTAKILSSDKQFAATETSKQEESVATDEAFITEESVLNQQKAEETVKAESSIQPILKTELSFLNLYNQKPSEFLTGIQTFNSQIAKSETTSNQEFVIEEIDGRTDETIKASNTNHLASSRRHFGNALSFVAEIVGKIGSAISPTVIAQEMSSESLKGQNTNGLLAPEAGETVCVDGNTDNSSCADGFSLPANESTTITFRAVVNANSTASSIPNTATAAGVNSNTVTTTVFQPVTIGKVFNPTSILSGGTSVVTLTLTNPTAANQTAAAFSDTLTNMSAVGGSVTGTCAGTTPSTLAADATALSFSGITVPASSSCTVIFSVKSSTAGTHPNTTSAVATTQSPSGGTASNTANLTVFNLPTIGKAFGPAAIQSGGTSTVTLTLSNTNPTALTNASFSDTLSGMSAVGGTVGGTCTGTTPSTLAAAATALSFSGITIPANNSCTVTFAVTSSTVGTRPNTTSGVTTTQTTSGLASNTANLTVIAPPTIAKAFSPTSITAGGNTTVTLTLTNPNSTGALTNASFSDTLVNMSAVGGAVTGTCVGTTPNTLSAGATALSFSGITIPNNNANCTVIFSVSSSTVGVQPNTTTGVTTAQTSVAGQVSNTANLTVNAPPEPPTITAATNVIRSQGNLVASANSQIATVNDADQTENTLVVTIRAVGAAAPGGGTATVNGVTVSGIAVDASGNVTANVVADATATTASFTVRVTDAQGTFAEATLTVTVVVDGFESDMAPRPNGDGNGRVNGGDVTQIQRFVVGLDKPYQSNEFQRADSAPRLAPDNVTLMLGDGSINGGDVTQAQRYAVNLDGGTVATGGPTAPPPPPPPMMMANQQSGFMASEQLSEEEDAQKESKQSLAAAPEANVYTVTAVRQSLTASTLTVAIVLNSDAGSTGAASVSGTLRFLPTAISMPTNIRLGSGAPAGTSFFPNGTETASGKLGFTINAPVNQTFALGQQQLLLIDFQIVGTGSTQLSFDNSQAELFVGGVNGNPASTTAPTFPTNTVSLSPTAATVSVSGRVMTAKRNGITGVQVSLTDSNGQVRTTVTKEGGYYRFDEVEVGTSYIITATGKRYSFSQPSQVLNINEETEEVNFIASPIKRLIL